MNPLGATTRRELIQRGGLLGAALAIGDWRATSSSGAATAAARIATASNLRKSIVLGPAGCILPGSPQDLRYGNNLAWITDSRTQWVHMWADWVSLEPWPGVLDTVRLSSLGAQVDMARAGGRKVMLTLYRFPTWANGTWTMTSGQLAATMPDRRRRDEPDSKAKPLDFRYPDDLSETGPWGRFLELLMRLFAGSVDVIEVCNEPNYQMWPQQGPSTSGDPYEAGPVTIYDTVARMFATAQAIQTRVGPAAPILAGPACADTDTGGRLRTPYDTFTSELLNELFDRKFNSGPRFAYSHHNYNDVTYDQGTGSTAPDASSDPSRFINRAAEVRRRLVNRWSGWPSANAQSPHVMLTEGGVTLGNIAANWGITNPVDQRTKQAELLKRNWDRMASNSADGAGIAMLSQYLLHTDYGYDSGLCEAPEAGGATRPAYGTWKSFPSYA